VPVDVPVTPERSRRGPCGYYSATFLDRLWWRPAGLWRGRAGEVARPPALQCPPRMLGLLLTGKVVAGTDALGSRATSPARATRRACASTHHVRVVVLPPRSGALQARGPSRREPRCPPLPLPVSSNPSMSGGHCSDRSEGPRAAAEACPATHGPTKNRERGRVVRAWSPSLRSGWQAPASLPLLCTYSPSRTPALSVQLCVVSVFRSSAVASRASNFPM
jgi:hypothetical protein